MRKSVERTQDSQKRRSRIALKATANLLAPTAFALDRISANVDQNVGIIGMTALG